MHWRSVGQRILFWLIDTTAHSSKVRKAAQPPKPADVRNLVLELVRDNPGWGYTWIRDALRGLKI